MLKHLSIENYALIDQLDIDFFDDFSVISGETGAGKSILLGALSLILGQRADVMTLRDKNKKCIIEGTFDVSQYELETFFNDNDLDYTQNSIFRREINPQGKSRAFINDTPVNLNILKEISEQLINIHSQNEILTLHQSDFQLSVIDSFAGISDKVKEYALEFKFYKKLSSQLDELLEQERQSKTNFDYYQFLFTELENSNLKPGEYHEIESLLQLQLNISDFKSSVSQCTHLLSESDENIIERINFVRSLLQKHKSYFPGDVSLFERIDSVYVEIKDISSELNSIQDNIVANPEEIDKLSMRIDLLNHLLQKHHVEEVEKLIDIQNDLSDKLLLTSDLSEAVEKLRKSTHKQFEKISILANALSKLRGKAIPLVEKELKSLFAELAMPDALIQIRLTEAEILNNTGKDYIRFYFSANKGFEPQEISKVASGGETSRVLLAIKSLISKSNLLPTIIFDEIDNGVSGQVASKVANIMKKLSGNMQVIAITHLPQIAAIGKQHYLVFKQNRGEVVNSTIKLLSKEEHIQEVARMLSSDKITDTSIEAAKQLINI